MKTVLTTLLISVLFLACNQVSEQDQNQSTQNGVSESQPKELNLNGLALNNGLKWKADESTNAHVRRLEEILNTFDANKKSTLEAYLETGNVLQSEIELLIQGCRMQGPDHDALHHWLEPLMNSVRNLQESKAMDEALGHYELINEQVKLFPIYFE